MFALRSLNTGDESEINIKLHTPLFTLHAFKKVVTGLRDLSSLPLGQSGLVLCLRAGEGTGRRLMDLGFTSGAETACLLAAPGNGMRAYRIRGTVVALRKKEARQIILKEERHE